MDVRAERTSERGAAVAATVLMIAALALGACTEGASERRSRPPPTATEIVVDPNDIAVADFGGFGAEWDPYTVSASPRVPAAVTERIAFMRLPFVRVRMFASWYADVDNHYDFSNRAMRPLYELLDAARANGTDVILTEWGSDDWSQDPWPIDDPRYAMAVADGVDHLIRRRGYTNIRYVVIVNEPNHNVALPAWKTALVNLDRELRARNLLELVRILGPDLGNNPWPAASLADVADLLSAWDEHIYPEPEDVRSGRTEATLRSAWERVRSSLGWTAPFVLGESGFATWGQSEPTYAVDMADYAIQATRAGTSMMSAWMLDDESYPGGLDTEPPKWFGTWSTRAKGSALKPWFYTWSLLCRLVRPGSTLYLATQPTDLRVLAAHDVSAGRWTFVVVNRRLTVARHMTIRVPGGGGAVTYRRYLFDGTRGTGPRDASGFPVPVVSGRSGDLERGISVTIPPDSVAFVATSAG